MRGIALALVAAGWAAEPPLLEPADEMRLEASQDLLYFLEDFQNGGVSAAERERAWSALWKGEKVLRPRIVHLVREALLLHDEENGPLKGLAMPALPVLGDDHQEKVQLYKRVYSLGLEPDVRELAELIVDHADLADVRVAVEVLRRERPTIELSSAETSFASVGVVMKLGGRPRISLRPGVALVPAKSRDEQVFQIESGGVPYYPIPASSSYYLRHGLGVPSLDVFAKSVEPVATATSYGGALSIYADGSAYQRFSKEHLAGVLLHELFHLDTLRLGGGANAQARELRSFLPQFRLYYNLHALRGGADFLDVNLKTYSRWLRNPASLNYFLEAAYSPENSGAARLSPWDQAREFLALLKLPPKGFEEARRREAAGRGRLYLRMDRGEREYLARVGVAPRPEPGEPAAEPSEPEDWRAELAGDLRRLPRDAELELEARLEDWWWRRARLSGETAAR